MSKEKKEVEDQLKGLKEQIMVLREEKETN